MDESCSAFDPKTWGPHFRTHTTRATFVYLPQSFLTRLLDGTLVTGTPTGTSGDRPLDETWYDGTPVEDDADSSPASTPQETAVDRSTEVDRRVREEIAQAIRESGGAVAPKLGRVAPSDAEWIMFDRSMRCETVPDLLTLLAASERVMRHVTSQTNSSDVTPTSPREIVLTLRQWLEQFEHTREYRVFVRRGKVVALAQRGHAAMGGAIRDISEEEMNRVVSLVEEHFLSVVRPRFGVIVRDSLVGVQTPHVGNNGIQNEREHTHDRHTHDSDSDVDHDGIDEGIRTDADEFTNVSYVYDVYFDRSWRLWVIDFSPWGSPHTDPLLFEWEELESAPWMQNPDHHIRGSSDGTDDSAHIENDDDAPDTSFVSEDPPATRPRAQLRCVSTTSAMRPATTMYSGLPMELRHANATSAIAEALENLMRETRNAGELTESDDDDDGE